METTTLGRNPRRISRVGFGCYRVDDRIPLHREALTEALLSGVNLIDTSTNYADGHSELLVGEVLRELVEKRKLAREDVVVVTKAGYVQGSNQREAVRRQKEGRPWTGMTELSRDCWHCISPDFLGDQLTASLERLRSPSVEVLLLHNPEYFLKDAEHRGVPLGEARDLFYDRVRRAFAWLEEEAGAGRIGSYGVSSNTFVVPRGNAEAVDLTRLLPLAGPRFSVIQLPMNPLELGAREPIHMGDGRSVLDVAREAGLGVLVNRPLNAFGPGGLVRFAEASLPFPYVASGGGDPWPALAEAEEEFRTRWAPRFKVENSEQSPAELLALKDLLSEMAGRIPDVVTFGSVWEQHVEPRLQELLPHLEELFEELPAFREWSARYRQRVYAAASAAAERPLAREKDRVAVLQRTLAGAFGDVTEATLSQRTLRALAGTPGVDVVLVGMRRPEYVRDALAAFAAEARKV